METENFKAGETVVHKSGGENMVITEIEGQEAICSVLINHESVKTKFLLCELRRPDTPFVGIWSFG
ncbi:hypothetical protein [Novosphingobium beihaiensis]|uniref:Uncharacterized protein n=1 Tax=Novosphingobium beihaiensis TaxID=2930389 RepID=A0ABT0BN52_9SPHN|nr:hypothetical protein [Novosphingobium beihaiensis]MCJ2186477.1 hypothetical protein [Novosphingobium beihaiensis]